MCGSTETALWIGGPSGVGKTTVARRLARRYGLRWYNADAHTWEHRDRALDAGDPAAATWEAMTPEERWLATRPEEMLHLSLNLTRWRMLADDVAGLPRSPLVLAEGTTVLPDLVEARDRRPLARAVAPSDRGAPARAARVDARGGAAGGRARERDRAVAADR